LCKLCSGVEGLVRGESTWEGFTWRQATEDKDATVRSTDDAGWERYRGCKLAKCVEDLRSVRSAIAKKSKLLTELEVASSNLEALSHFRREITNDKARCEKLIFQQGMEEHIVARSQKVILACEIDILELSYQLESTIKSHAETSHRVSSMEKLVHAMTG
jgi:hypothetical protein